jgi:hypothetical protein
LKAKREREREETQGDRQRHVEREDTHTHQHRQGERETHTQRVTTKVERIQSLDVLMEQEQELVANLEIQLAKCVVLETNLVFQLLVEWELERGGAEL